MAIGICFTFMILATVIGARTAGPKPRPGRVLTTAGAAIPRDWDRIAVLSISIPACGAFFFVSALVGHCLALLGLSS